MAGRRVGFSISVVIGRFEGIVVVDGLDGGGASVVLLTFSSNNPKAGLLLILKKSIGLMLC